MDIVTSDRLFPKLNVGRSIWSSAAYAHPYWGYFNQNIVWPAANTMAIVTLFNPEAFYFTHMGFYAGGNQTGGAGWKLAAYDVEGNLIAGTGAFTATANDFHFEALTGFLPYGIIKLALVANAATNLEYVRHPNIGTTATALRVHGVTQQASAFSSLPDPLTEAVCSSFTYMPTIGAVRIE